MTDDFKFDPNSLDYLKEFNQGGCFDKEIIKPSRKKTLKVKHKEAVTWMLKAIKICKMDEELKMILRMRMWGHDSNVFNPMSCRNIAIKMGVRVAIVEDFEREAKEKLKDFLKGKNLSDIISTFNKNQLGGNVLTDHLGRPITG